MTDTTTPTDPPNPPTVQVGLEALKQHHTHYRTIYRTGGMSSALAHHIEAALPGVLKRRPEHFAQGLTKSHFTSSLESIAQHAHQGAVVSFNVFEQLWDELLNPLTTQPQALATARDHVVGLLDELQRFDGQWAEGPMPEGVTFKALCRLPGELEAYYTGTARLVNHTSAALARLATRLEAITQLIEQGGGQCDALYTTMAEIDPVADEAFQVRWDRTRSTPSHYLSALLPGVGQLEITPAQPVDQLAVYEVTVHPPVGHESLLRADKHTIEAVLARLVDAFDAIRQLLDKVVAIQLRVPSAHELQALLQTDERLFTCLQQIYGNAQHLLHNEVLWLLRALGDTTQDWCLMVTCDGRINQSEATPTPAPMDTPESVEPSTEHASW